MSAANNDMQIFMVNLGDKSRVKTTKEKVLAVFALINDYQDPETEEQWEIYQFFNQKADYTNAVEALEKGNSYGCFDLDGNDPVGISRVSFDDAKLAASKV